MIQNVGKLAAALAWAARGFRVFPLAPNSKDPPGFPWTEDATTDPEKIKMWWWDPVLEAERDHNIGCLTSNLIVADVDVKDGRDGLDTALSLDLDFETLTVRTPSRGFHLYYQPLPDRRTGQSPIAEGIDTRSFNGFVVAPGSTIDGVAYEVCEDLPLAPFPPHLAGRMKEPKARQSREGAESVEMDTPEAIEAALRFLSERAKNAEKGQRGETCIKVSAELRDLAISEEFAVEILAEYWNPKNKPPMTRDDLVLTVNHGYRYAQNGVPGSKLPTEQLGEINYIGPPTYIGGIDEPVVATPVAIAGEAFDFGRAIPVENLTPREWVVHSLMVPKTITSLLAGGGAGKSVLSLVIAAHIAVGKSFLGHRIVRPGKSLVYNAEDELKEMSLRLKAICDHYGFDYEFVNSQIGMMTSEDGALNVVSGSPLAFNPVPGNLLTSKASNPEVVAVFLDPLVEVHDGDENDAGQMKTVLQILRAIARETDVAIVLVHHTSKPARADPMGFAGDQNAGRGSTVLPNASRVVLTMVPVSGKEREKLGIPSVDTSRYVRLDGAKANFSENSGKPRYMRWAKRIVATEEIGVLIEHDEKDAMAMESTNLARAIWVYLINAGAAIRPINECTDGIRAAEPLVYGKDDVMAVRSKIRRLLVTWVSTGQGMTVRYFNGQCEIGGDGDVSGLLVPKKLNPP